MANLLIISPEVPRVPFDEQRRREEADECPRATYFDEVVAEGNVLDGAYMRSLKGWRAALYRRLPAPVAVALEAYRIRCRYDTVVCWDDRITVVYGLLLRLTRSKSRHVAMLTWMVPEPKKTALALAQRGINHIIVWSNVHRELLVELYGIKASKITCIPYQVDQRFWRPIDHTLDGIFAVGNSKRDYKTLIQAMRGLPITCRIATSVMIHSAKTIDWDITRESLANQETGSNVIIGAASPLEIRAMYARSRFVVMPLAPNFCDNGITVATEAMAMGKAIICTYTYGLVDIIEHGVNGLFVPPGDPTAMREAIQYLWDNPEIAERMGQEGRRRAESIFALERFTASVCDVVKEVADRGVQNTGPTQVAPARSPLLRLPSPI